MLKWFLYLVSPRKLVCAESNDFPTPPLYCWPPKLSFQVKNPTPPNYYSPPKLRFHYIFLSPPSNYTPQVIVVRRVNDIGNHIVHRLKVIPVKTNGSIFVKVSKTPFWPPFWPKTAKRNFFIENRALSVVFIYHQESLCQKSKQFYTVGSTKTFN